MTRWKAIVAGAVLLSLLLNAVLLWRMTGGDRRYQVQLTSPDQIEVIRTPGGLLQVSSIKSPETFHATKDHTILGLQFGKTTSHIRVPATFNYHIELAQEWKVTVRNGTFIVVAPRVKPTLPVAIDTARLEQFSSGNWALFTGPAELDALQRSITQTLAVKARSPTYLQMQREDARKTVTEFVAQWLATQERWKDAPKNDIRVFFADEPIEALRGLPPPYVSADS